MEQQQPQPRCGVHRRRGHPLGCPRRAEPDGLTERRGGRFRRQGRPTDARDAAARYANKRAEMWGFMKEWLKKGSLPDDNELLADLKAVDYGCDASDAILLRRKRSPSPIRSPSATGSRRKR